MRLTTIGAVLAGLCLTASSASAQTLAVGLDADASMTNGQVQPAPDAKGDKVVFLALDKDRLRVVSSVAAPISFQGPPRSIAFSPSARLAFATAYSAPADAKTFAPIDVLSVIDLSGATPKVSQTLRLGASLSAVTADTSGRRLVVTHGDDDSVTLLVVENGKVEMRGRTRFAKGSKPLAAAFLPDGRSVLVTFSGANKIGLYPVDDQAVGDQPIREMSAGVYPTSVAVCGASGYAVVANYGVVSGDVDTVSLIDLRARPVRVVDTASVGVSPEGMDCSADGRWVIATTQNMTTVPADDPLYRPKGEAVLLGIEAGRLVPRDRAEIGGWGQGAAFVDGGSIAAFETILDRSLHVFRVDGGRLTRLPPVVFEAGGPASLGVGR